MHRFHQVLDNGHAQTGALSVGNVFLGEGIEDMLQKRLAHADASVGNEKFINDGCSVKRDLFCAGINKTAFFIILDGIAEKI